LILAAHSDNKEEGLNNGGNVQQRQRRYLALKGVVAIAFSIAMVVGLCLDMTKPVSDFVEYWGAGRLNTAGSNPYDPQNLASL
jgi:hypothetical protein